MSPHRDPGAELDPNPDQSLGATNYPTVGGSARSPSRTGLSLSHHVTWATLLSGSVSVLGIALWLKPSPAGVGTHTQLGLPPCGILAATGYPCPGCGMTTAFASMVRGNLPLAWTANPAGILLFLATALFVVFAAHAWLKKEPPGDAFFRVRADRIMISLSVLSVVVWLYRVVHQYAHGHV